MIGQPPRSVQTSAADCPSDCPLKLIKEQLVVRPVQEAVGVTSVIWKWHEDGA